MGPAFCSEGRGARHCSSASHRDRQEPRCPANSEKAAAQRPVAKASGSSWTIGGFGPAASYSSFKENFQNATNFISILARRKSKSCRKRKKISPQRHTTLLKPSRMPEPSTILNSCLKRHHKGLVDRRMQTGVNTAPVCNDEMPHERRCQTLLCIVGQFYLLSDFFTCPQLRCENRSASRSAS